MSSTLRVTHVAPFLLGSSALLWLSACQGETNLSAHEGVDSADTASPASTDGPAFDSGSADTLACPTPVQFEPADGAAHVDPYGPVVVHFNGPFPAGVEPTLTVAGEPVDARLDPSRTTLRTSPRSFERGDTVRILVDHCEERTLSTFRTLGPIVTPEALEARTWSVALDSVQIDAPSAVQQLLPSLALDHLMLSTDVEDDGLLHLWARMGIEFGTRILPLPCDPPVDLGPISLIESPRFQVQAPSLPLGTGPNAIRASRVHGNGVFGASGERVEAFELRTRIDVRELDHLVDPGVDLCALSAQHGQPCLPCGDGEDACMVVAIRGGLGQPNPSDLFADLWEELGELCQP